MVRAQPRHQRRDRILARRRLVGDGRRRHGGARRAPRRWRPPPRRDASPPRSDQQGDTRDPSSPPTTGWWICCATGSARPSRPSAEAGNERAWTVTVDEARRIAAELSGDAQPATQPPRHGRARRRNLGLTERELDVLGELVAGHTNEEIASALAISHKTVMRSHRQRVPQARRTGPRRSGRPRPADRPRHRLSPPHHPWFVSPHPSTFDECCDANRKIRSTTRR